MSEELFECPNHAGSLRLSPSSCSSMWARSQRPDERCGPLRVCRDCEIGARHSGVSVKQVRQLSKARKAKRGVEGICVRCGEQPRRFIRSGICVSCYNREREAAVGKNRRGYPPRLPPPASLQVSVADGCVRERERWLGYQVLEAMLMAVRRHDGRVLIGRAPPTSGRQLSLWGGL